MQHELRRIKQRLQLFDQEGLNGLLFDILEGTEEQKMQKIEALKKKYKKFIYDNSPRDPRQSNLFRDTGND